MLATRRHYTHTWIHETLVDLLTIQKEIHTGLFAVMDGTTVGNGPGPRTMVPVRKDVLLASADQVAIDAVAAKLMGFDPRGIRYLALAHERGLGVADPRDIELVGDPEIGQEDWHFSVGDNLASRVGDLLWFGPLKRLQRALLSHAAGVHLRRRLVPLPRLPLVPGVRPAPGPGVRTHLAVGGALRALPARAGKRRGVVGPRRCRDGLGHAPRLMGGR